MKKSTERKMYFVGTIMLAVPMAGVAFILIFNAVHASRFHEDLLATKALTLQFKGPDNVELQDAHAYVRKDGLVVSGCLNRTMPAAGPPTSQVDVKLLSARALVLDQTSIRDLSRCKRGGVHFSTTFPTNPSDASTLAIRAFAPQVDDSAMNSSSHDPGS